MALASPAPEPFEPGTPPVGTLHPGLNVWSKHTSAVDFLGWSSEESVGEQMEKGHLVQPIELIDDLVVQYIFNIGNFFI